jgi:hypothetical protein
MYKLKQGYQRAGLCSGAYHNRHGHNVISQPHSAALCSGVSCIPISMGQALDEKLGRAVPVTAAFRYTCNTKERVG